MLASVEASLNLLPDAIAIQSQSSLSLRQSCESCGRSHSSVTRAAECASRSTAAASRSNMLASVAAAFNLLPRAVPEPSASDGFVTELGKIKLIHCSCCGEATFGHFTEPVAPATLKHFVTVTKCGKCAVVRSKHCLKFQKSNHMHLSSPPIHLPKLTDIEESLISLHSPVLRFFRLRGGSWGYGGSCVSITQAVDQVATRLPRVISSLDLVIVVKEFAGNTGESIKKNFRVRKSAVLAWLNFLKAHNPLYAGVEVGEAEDLPEDSGGSLDHLNCHVQVQEEDALSKFDDTINQEGILHSVVDGWAGGPALENPLIIDSMKWPDRGTDAIREFGTPNILAKCFPTVFPWGVGDPTSPSRTTGVTLSEGIHHLQNFAVAVGTILHFPFAEHRVAPYYAHDVQVTPTHYHLCHSNTTSAVGILSCDCSCARHCSVNPLFI